MSTEACRPAEPARRPRLAGTDPATALQSATRRRMVSSGWGAKGSFMAEQITGGGHFPQLTFNAVGGGAVTLPDDIATPYAVALFYRGHW